MTNVDDLCAFSVTICRVRADCIAMFTLLFIEDDEAIRTALRLVLEDEGYEVAVAGDGETGGRGLQHRRGDLQEPRGTRDAGGVAGGILRFDECESWHGAAVEARPARGVSGSGAYFPHCQKWRTAP